MVSYTIFAFALAYALKIEALTYVLVLSVAVMWIARLLFVMVTDDTSANNFIEIKPYTGHGHAPMTDKRYGHTKRW